MKRSEDIENLGLEELERMADESAVKVPDDLFGKVEDAILASALMEEEKARAAVRRPLSGYAIGGILAAAVASLVLLLSLPHAPKDTFDDPLVAYAELEKTFSYISSKVDRGLDIAAEAEPAIEKTTGALNRTIKNR